MMKSKNQKIQNIILKGIAIALVGMFTISPMAYAATSIDDNSIGTSFWDKLVNGTVGSAVEEIKDYFSTEGKTTLYISNETQLRAFAQYVNEGNNCEGKIIKLSKDIQLNTNEEWVPIGRGATATEAERPFNGTFDGQGHIIRGLNFNRNNKTYNELSYIGLFGYALDATIKNVTIADSRYNIEYITATDIYSIISNSELALGDIKTDNGKYYEAKYKCLGGIVGYIKNGTVDNCNIENDVEVKGLIYVGGIAGNSISSTIKNCNNNAVISGFLAVGGIVGREVGDITSSIETSDEIDFSKVKGKVLKSNNNGRVIGIIGNSGGIAGSVKDNAIIQECTNTGNVEIATKTIQLNIIDKTSFEKSPENAGGIAGYVTGTYSNGIKGYVAIDTCINKGNVKAYVDAGGIAGQLGGLDGGYAIASSNINYAENIISTKENDYDEAGYIAGEVGSDGTDGKGGTNDDSYVYAYNNYYVMKEDVLNTITQSEMSIAADETTVNAQYKSDYISVDNNDNVKKAANNAIYCDKKLNNKNTNTIQLAYARINSYETTEKVTKEYFTDISASTSVILDSGNAYYAILDRGYGETKYYAKKLDNSNYFFDKYGVSNIYIGNGTSKKFELDTQKKVKIRTDKIGLKINGNEWVVNEETDSEKFYVGTTGTNNKEAIKYEIYKGNDKVTGTTLFKEGEKIVAKLNVNKYLASTYGPLKAITTDEAPILKINDSIEMKCTKVNATTSNYTTELTYEYTAKTGDEFDVNTLNLSKQKNAVIYMLSSDYQLTNNPTWYTDSEAVNISGIRVDTLAPTISTKVYTEEKLETGRYTKGKEIIIETTTSEQIKEDYVTPEIQISFSKSGRGKYNYTSEDKVGYAKCKGATISVDGKTTWKYSYIIQEGDEGNIQLEYKKGSITDLAGNTSDLSIYKNHVTDNDSNTSVELKGTIQGNNKGTNVTENKNIEYKFYKVEGNSKKAINEAGTYVKNSDVIAVEVIVDGFVYTSYENGTSENKATLLTKDTAPDLKIDGVSAKAQSVTISETPATNVKQQLYTNPKTTITYTIEGKDFNKADITRLSKALIKPKQVIYVSDRYVKEFASQGAGTEALYDVGMFNKVVTEILTSTTMEKDITGLNIYVDPVGIAETFTIDNIYADTTLPTVEITAEKINEDKIEKISNNVTNAEKIRYTFTWNEELSKEDGSKFEESDIKINNGTKGTLSTVSKNENGTYSYTMDVTTNVENGNVGDIQVIIEQDSCKDLVGQGNVRTESVIRVDKKSPELKTIEAYAEGTELGTVKDIKQYYKIGDKITIIATFDENIENTEKDSIPELALQFSESGNAKGTVSKGTINGNKITYTYTITEGDTGTLSIKGFSGIVTDVAGNETKVTKRELTGDSIIADSEAPKITGITAIAPDFKYDSLITDGETKRYGLKNQIKIKVDFNEEIYNKAEEKINTMTKETAPTLKLKFGTGTERTATYNNIEGKTITYIYDIQSGDNGDLSITTISGTVVDIAGNTADNYKLPKLAEYEESISEENKVERITADTTKPNISLSVTGVENNNLAGTNNHYKAGDIITVTATTNEYIYQKSGDNLDRITKENTPSLQIKFSESGNAKGTIRNASVDYKDNKTTLTYEYTITSGDNGNITLGYSSNEYYDIALNENNAGTTSSSSKNVTADTIAPNTSHLQGTNDNAYIVDNGNGTYTVKFTEKLYYLENNRVNELTNSNVVKNGPKLVLGISGEYKSIEPSTINADGTEITYKAEKGLERIGVSTYDKICDIAGNMYNSNIKQDVELLNIKVVKPEDKTGTYSAGTQIELVATFSKRIVGTVPSLKIKFGTGTEKTINVGQIDKDTIAYTYEIAKGDNGALSIVSLKGTGLRGEDGSNYSEPENITLSGTGITADTTKPTAIIKAYSNYENKTEITGKTNSEMTIYEITWSEEVRDFNEDDIVVVNGVKDTFKKINSKVYTLTVNNSNEGTQTIAIPSGVCRDMAKTEGNTNESARINAVVIDKTAPTVRFVTPNGGNYTIGTDTKKANLTARIELNEDIATLKYRVVKEGTTAPDYNILTADQINSSDVNIEIKNVDVGNYYIELIAIDEAGNQRTAKSNKYNVTENTITLSASTTEKTDKDVTVSVKYGEALTENRKAGVQGKTQSADPSTVIISENGVIYAEATDRFGNKVYATLKIDNIEIKEEAKPNPEPEPEPDKTAPELTFNYTTTTATVGTTIGATITTNEDAVISYSWDNSTWTESEGYVRSQRVTKTPNKAGTYTLYAKAKDKSGNTSDVTNLKFTIIKSEIDIKKPEVIFEDLTTIQKDGVKYVKTSTGFTIENLNNKMNKDALLGYEVKYEKLTSDNKLRTGSEIVVDGDTKYVVIVNGDVNCDGEVDFLNDIVLINNYRIGVTKNLSDIQILAGDINNSGSIEFIPDIVAMNNYRLGRIKAL